MVSRSPSSQPDLRVFRDPASVAVVGASNNPAKWGYWLASGALGGRDHRTVHLVNRSAGDVLGQACAPDLGSLPEVPELVALCVPAPEVVSVVEDGRALGVRGYLAITAGVPREAELATRIRESGGRLLGANSLGLYDADSHLQLAWGHFSPGPLAIVTQSGQVGSELTILCARHQIGISRFVSLGNQSDVTAAELVADLASHESTRVIALYLEGFADGELLFDTLRRLRAAGKPTLLLTAGGSGASARLAFSHTGSLTPPTAVVDAACRAAGVLRVQTPSELVSVVRGYLAGSAPRGRRVGVVGDSGGQCGLAADVAVAQGLLVPELAEATTRALGSVLPAGAAHDNPVDLAGAGEASLTAYATVLDRVLGDPGVDAAVLTGYFGRYGTDNPELATPELEVADRVAAAARAHGKALVVHTLDPHGAVADALWRAGVPVTGRIEDAMRTLGGLSALHEPLPARPTPPPTQAGPVGTDYWAARTLLATAGVRFPEARPLRAAADARRVATELIGPFVLKAAWIEHKSEDHAVQLGLADGDQLAAAYTSMRARLGDGEYVVEQQDTRQGCVELLVGARRDPGLGPVVVVGCGGTETELWQDVALERAPVSVDAAAAMVTALRCAPLLSGWRGRPAIPIRPLAELVSAVSHLLAARPAIAELELNPVRVSPEGVLAVDALVIADRHPTVPAPARDVASQQVRRSRAPRGAPVKEVAP